MYIYAGIDEAGYGPMFGPLVVGRTVFAIPKLPAGGPPPHLWQRLSKAVCRGLTGRNGRIAINDSKRLKSQASGIKHLELGCLAFAALAGHRPSAVADWLEILGEECHRSLPHLPWYEPTAEHPWQPLPTANTDGEIAVARGLLTSTCHRIGVDVPDLGAAVVLEDRFNEMTTRMRSKAATSFTFVARHLLAIWERFGEHGPLVAVDRQGGRQNYRDRLMLDFPDAHLIVHAETPDRSAYELRQGPRTMRIEFVVDAEQQHMPVALASMIAKYTRELFMARFQAWFAERCPDIRPTAGYATDARRFWEEIQPRLPDLAIPAERLCRVC